MLLSVGFTQGDLRQPRATEKQTTWLTNGLDAEVPCTCAPRIIRESQKSRLRNRKFDGALDGRRSFVAAFAGGG